MGLIWELIKAASDTHDSNDAKEKEELEKEKDFYNLEEWQKDLVRKGDYDPWNFEDDEDLEDDDYCHDDDI